MAEPPYQRESIVIRYSGGTADKHVLRLEDYAASLNGLKDLINSIVALVLRNNPHTQRLRPDQIIRMEVRSERPGSWEITIDILTRVAGAAIYDILKVGGRRALPQLIKLFRGVIRQHVTIKKDTLDVDAIADALDNLARQHHLQLDPPAPEPDADQLEFFPLQKEEEAEEEDSDDSTLQPTLSKRRAFVEHIDHAMKELAAPIGSSCTQLKIVSSSLGEIVTLTTHDKLVIDEPLTLLPTQRDWRPATIKFVRINRKTGRSLMYYADDPAGEDNTHYSIIVDSAVRNASNVYTEAFSKDAPLQVYLRHAPHERGRIRVMWEITTTPPERDLYAGYPALVR